MSADLCEESKDDEQEEGVSGTKRDVQRSELGGLVSRCRIDVCYMDWVRVSGTYQGSEDEDEAVRGYRIQERETTEQNRQGREQHACLACVRLCLIRALPYL